MHPVPDIYTAESYLCIAALNQHRKYEEEHIGEYHQKSPKQQQWTPPNNNRQTNSYKKWNHAERGIFYR